MNFLIFKKNFSNIFYSIRINQTFESNSSNNTPKPTLNTTVILLKAMFELEKILDSIKIPSLLHQKDDPFVVFPGYWMVELFVTSGFSCDPQQVRYYLYTNYFCILLLLHY